MTTKTLKTMKPTQLILLATAVLCAAQVSIVAQGTAVKELPAITKRRPAPPEKFDLNKDGKLDPAEKEAMRKDILARVQSLRSVAIDEFDKDQNGILDDQEKAALKKARAERRQAVKGMALLKFDKNANGKIDDDERPPCGRRISNSWPTAAPRSCKPTTQTRMARLTPRKRRSCARN